MRAQRACSPRRSRWRALLALGAGALALGVGSSCGSSSDANGALACPALSLDCQGTAPSYAAEVAPIIQADCAGSGCHSPSTEPDAPWAFESEGDVADWSFVIRNDIADCLMPPRGHEPALSEADRETLNAWLVCGSPDN